MPADVSTRLDLRSIPFMLVAVGALGAGLAAGLARLGWALPGAAPSLHGELMVSGFFGTLIGLERAVAVGRPVAYLVPALSALGAGAWLGGSATLGALLVGFAGLLLLGLYAGLLRRQPARFLAVEALGAAAWTCGSIRMLTGAAPGEVALWGMAFLVLTIAGERLELSRLVRPPHWATAAFDGLVAAVLAGLAANAAGHAWGVRGAGLAFVGMAAWLSRFDVARHTVRGTGLPRYIAVCLLTGYAGLAAGGALMAAVGPVQGGPLYDALLHAVFVGFVLSMVFGHAPVIFPAVVGVPIPFRRGFYAPLLLLHASLALRLWGDLAGSFSLRRQGARLNAVAVVLFLGCVVASAFQARRSRLSNPGDLHQGPGRVGNGHAP